MDTVYELKINEFQGPLGKLLELIEARQMEVTRVSLATVTADFLKYLGTLEKSDPRVIADFINVAAKLILIKSHALLPQLMISDEEEKEIVDLEIRLKIYKTMKETEPGMKNLWLKHIAYSRDYLAGVQPGFYLTQNISQEDLLIKIRKLANELAIFLPKQESTKMKLMNLEEKINELITRVDKVFKTSFNELTKDKDRSEIIVFFLALLHLLKDNLVHINQKDGFSDIEIATTKSNVSI